jgi:hypothetical protein
MNLKHLAAACAVGTLMWVVIILAIMEVVR